MRRVDEARKHAAIEACRRAAQACEDGSGTAKARWTSSMTNVGMRENSRDLSARRFAGGTKSSALGVSFHCFVAIGRPRLLGIVPINPGFDLAVLAGVLGRRY